MKREIKFRAWLPNQKQMSTLYGFTLNISGEVISTNEAIVMQFTGLKDKNGKEIYEGDIVIDQLDRIYTIEYSVDTCSFKLVKDFDSGSMFDKRGKFVLFDAMNLAIVGNIYENPELIKKGCD